LNLERLCPPSMRTSTYCAQKFFSFSDSPPRNFFGNR
jgi:hypothetical protein